jgi:hypothetical protein
MLVRVGVERGMTPSAAAAAIAPRGVGVSTFRRDYLLAEKIRSLHPEVREWSDAFFLRFVEEEHERLVDITPKKFVLGK